jgi:tRNA nucleotidyltransferase/poly(A) polymerase
MDLEAPAAVIEIARKLHQSGHEAWAVGGAVRDAVLGRTGADWDLATNATPEQVQRLFRRTVPIGIEHGTVGVFGRDGVLYEVTTYRRDVATDGRHATVVFSDSLEVDLARRDFTCNAVAWNPLTQELRDPYGGQDDLRRGVLRTVGEPKLRFSEDYLRVLRAMRFAGHFNLRIDPATWEALVQSVSDLSRLSAERVREEITKVLAKTRTASTALRLYAESAALQVIAPEVAATVQLQIGDQASSDAWTLALHAVDTLPPHRVLLRWTALLHAIGYPAARTRDLRGGWRYTGHEELGARKAGELLKRLKFSNADSERIVRLIRIQSLLFPPDSPDSGVRRWLAHVTPEYVNDLFRLRIALWRANPVARGDRDLLERWTKAHRVLSARPVLTLEGLAIDGNDLRKAGMNPGPQMGEVLRRLLERVIEDPELNERTMLLDLARQAAEAE